MIRSLLELAAVCIVTLLMPTAQLAFAQQEEIPKDIAGSVASTLRFEEDGFYSVAAAMPEEKYSFVPNAGEFKGVRSFAEQVKHVACAQFGFFQEN